MNRSPTPLISCPSVAPVSGREVVVVVVVSGTKRAVRVETQKRQRTASVFNSAIVQPGKIIVRN